MLDLTTDDNGTLGRCRSAAKLAKRSSEKPACAVRCCSRTPARPSVSPSSSATSTSVREATERGWLGEIEGLQISLAGANDKLAQIDRRSRTTAVDLGFPSLTSSH